MAEIKIHEFQVAMTCEGCSGAVQRVLNKFEGKGVNKVSIDLPSQKVEVTSTLSPDQLMDILKKTGKQVTYVKST
ncbi:Heavy-metal-associated domain [Popillia japonica]|uniref:Copper transport protein ATOX1 n=1 Tax=Popillia japonica TaxID=7064 RepID=A0AAW1JGQ3_POPJA